MRLRQLLLVNGEVILRPPAWREVSFSLNDYEGNVMRVIH